MLRQANPLARGLMALVAALAGTLLASGPAAADSRTTAFDDGSTWTALVAGASDPDAAPGWQKPGFDDSSWPQLRAPFGTTGCDFPAYGTLFPSVGKVFVRKTFTLPAGAHALHISGTVDNWADVYLNGKLLGTTFDGACHRDGIQIDVDDADLDPGGTNVIAAVAGDYGWEAFFDLQGTYLRADDTVPPLVTVPEDQTLEATGPHGAVASFDATAEDVVDGSLPAGCSPASGSTFAIGATTVTCTATDAAGNRGRASFTVHVAGAEAQLEALGAFVNGIGPGSSLAATVQSIQSALARENMPAACGSLTALGHKARAQSGKSLTVAQAERIESDAARIGGVIGC